MLLLPPTHSLFLLSITLLSTPIQSLYLRQLPHAPNTKSPRATILDWDDAVNIKRDPLPLLSPASISQPEHEQINPSPPSNSIDPTAPQPEPHIQAPAAAANLNDLDLNTATTTTTTYRHHKRNTYQPPPLQPLPSPSPLPSPPSDPTTSNPEDPPSDPAAEAAAAELAKREWKAERARREAARASTPAAIAEGAMLARAEGERVERVIARISARGGEGSEDGEVRRGVEVDEAGDGKGGNGGEEGDALTGGEEGWKKDLLRRLDMLEGREGDVKGDGDGDGGVGEG